MKTGGRLVKHARYYWLMLAENYLTKRLFAGKVRRIGADRCAGDRVEGGDDTAKSGRSGMGVGEAFVECTEKTGFPGFGFSGQGDRPALLGRRRAREEECNSQDQKMAVRFIMNGTWKSKMEILDDTEA